MENEEKSTQHRSQNDCEKIQLCGCLGTLWGLFWRQDGARAITRAKQIEKCRILWLPGGAKMEPQSIKNLIKNRMNVESDFETTFCRSWVEVGAENLSEMRGLRVIFLTSLRRCEKYDFEKKL